MLSKYAPQTFGKCSALNKRDSLVPSPSLRTYGPSVLYFLVSPSNPQKVLRMSGSGVVVLAAVMSAGKMRCHWAFRIRWTSVERMLPMAFMNYQSVSTIEEKTTSTHDIMQMALLAAINQATGDDFTILLNDSVVKGRQGRTWIEGEGDGILDPRLVHHSKAMTGGVEPLLVVGRSIHTASATSAFLEQDCFLTKSHSFVAEVLALEVDSVDSLYAIVSRVLRSGYDRTLARRRRRPAAGIGCRSHQN